MHEDVALEFARWLDPIFAIWCNDRIKELIPYFDFKTKKNSKRADSAEELIKCTLHVAEFLLDKLGGSKATVAAFVNKTSRAIGIPEIDYVPSDGVKFSATDLLKKFGRTETIHQFNKKMIERGFWRKNRGSLELQKPDTRSLSVLRIRVWNMGITRSLQVIQMRCSLAILKRNSMSC